MKRDLESWCQKLAGNADWIGLREYSENLHEAVSRDGSLDGFKQIYDSGVMVEVLVDGQFSYGATDSFSFAEIEKITKSAVVRAKAAAKFKLFEADLSMRPKVIGEYRSLFSVPFDLEDEKLLKEVLEIDGDIHQKIKEEVKNRLIDKLTDEIETRFINKKWSGESEISDAVLDDLKEKQTELVREILKEFYDSYKYKIIIKRLSQKFCYNF